MSRRIAAIASASIFFVSIASIFVALTFGVSSWFVGCLLSIVYLLSLSAMLGWTYASNVKMPYEDRLQYQRLGVASFGLWSFVMLALLAAWFAR